MAELLRERNNFSTFGIPVYFCEKSLVTGSDWQCPGPVGSGWIHIDLFIWCQSLSRRRLFFHGDDYFFTGAGIDLNLTGSAILVEDGWVCVRGLVMLWGVGVDVSNLFVFLQF